MRLLFIHPFLFRYARGIERFTFSLASALVRQGVDVDLLTWHWPHELQVADLDPRVRVFRLPAFRYLAARLAVPFYIRHLLTHTYDFIWIYFAGYGEAESLFLASLLRQQQFGITFHYPYSQAPDRYREFNRFDLVGRAQRVVAISSFVAQGIRQELGREPIIIRSAADVNHFRPDPARRVEQRAALGLGPEDEIVLTAAALEERKGIQHLINALPSLRVAHPNLKYIVLGEGSFRAGLEALVRKEGLEAVVQLRGADSDIFPFYNTADIFALLSRGEGLPAAPIEAMAMELPMLSSDQPPFDEIMDPSYGITVGADKTTQVAAAIHALLQDRPRRALMGQAARARAVKEFTYEHMASQYIMLCNQAAESRKAITEKVHV